MCELVCVLPVVCVVVFVAGRGVDVVCDQPVEVFVAADSDSLHFSLRDVEPVSVKISEDHHVLSEEKHQHNA